MLTRTDIIKYYNEAELAYKDVWHLDSCLSLHYGFWGKGVRNLKTALIKENEVLSDIINITSKDIVLDAGCGIGSSSIYLSKKFNCQVTGITLGEKQVSKAIEAGIRHSVSHIVKFNVADYHHTEFENNSFTVVWFLESFCHSTDFNTLVKEAYRVLKPDGRLIIADGFANKENFSTKEKAIMKSWLKGWAINDIQTTDTVSKSLKTAGFSNINVMDYSDKIIKSSFRMYFFASIAIIYGKLISLFGRNYGNEISINNSIGAKYQYLALKKKLWKYHVITAVK